MTDPLIFDIKRYSINDGPGIRATIFFKGCPLSCVWCHNPEGISPHIQKLYTASKCIGAQDCIRVCEQNALKLTPNGIVTDPDLCNLCGACAKACPSHAIEMSGRTMAIADILRVLERERIHFDISGGGVTFSGGEPLMHHQFLIKLLKACGKEGYHRTVDTTGYAPETILLEVAENTDLFLYDLKLMNPAKHKRYTGVSNERILSNLKVLVRTGANVNIRIPLIKGINADKNNLEQSAKFIRSLDQNNITVNLLPYHDIARMKYHKLGLNVLLDGMAEPSNSEQEHALSLFKSFGVDASLGG